VFMIGLEQGTLPHIRAFDEPGGLQEERRLMYVGMTRAREQLFISHALQRTLFGNTSGFMASMFLADIPQELVEAEGTERSISSTASRPDRPSPSWKGAINTPSALRDNKDLELAVGDKVNHDTFGNGQVITVSGTNPRQTAEVRFDSGVTKRLLVKMAPISKI
jgi:DNA helicase-2/ATP-dependent DNA helicase PcrA